MERVGILVVLLLATVAANEWSRGWGDEIDWFNNIDSAKAEAAKEEKPIFALIHKSWCGACKALKPQLSTSQQFIEKSKSFVMANFEDEEEPAGTDYQIDGGYIPRIYFLSQEGNVFTEIYNKAGGNAQYKYYYSNPDAVLGSMDTALEAANSLKNKQDKREL